MTLTVFRQCHRCAGCGWVEVEQKGSHLAVTQCPDCDGTGRGNAPVPRETPAEEAKERLQELRKALVGSVKRVDDYL